MSNFISRFSDRIDDKLGGLYNKITHNPSAAERRQQSNMVNDQISAYKEQTNLAREQLNRTRDEATAQKRKIDEKQIRSLRRNFRPAGFLNNQQANAEPVGGTVQNLGG